MSTFDKREKSFEDKFALDAELQFKVRARRNKLVGLWAAGKMHLEGEAALEYAFAIIEEDNKVAGDSDIITKIQADLLKADSATSSQEIESQLLACEQEAKKQLLGH